MMMFFCFYANVCFNKLLYLNICLKKGHELCHKAEILYDSETPAVGSTHASLQHEH